MRIFGQLLLVDKVPYLYKTASKEFEFLHKSYATAVAMASLTSIPFSHYLVNTFCCDL
jgi:hypothetical protein